MECKIEGCTKPVRVAKRQLCGTHYQAWRLANRPRDGFKPCAIAGCDEAVYARNWCLSHYGRWQRTGSPLPPVKVKSACKAEGCFVIAWAAGLCKTCYSREWHHRRNANPRPVNPEHHNYKEVPGYNAAHQRLRAARGPASNYECACGCQRPAQDWALIPGTPDLLYGPIGTRNTLTAYSLDPMAYVPMHSDCHKAWDALTGNRSYKTGEHKRAS